MEEQAKYEVKKKTDCKHKDICKMVENIAGKSCLENCPLRSGKIKYVVLWKTGKECMDSESERYVIDEKCCYGITAIGYMFTDRITGNEIYVHPAQHHRIEIIEEERK